MTELLQELEQKLAALPQAEQAHWVSHFLEELSAETSAADGNAEDEGEGQWIGGRKPTLEEVKDAVDRLTEFRKGKILGDDITIKELINEGRR